MTVEKHPTRMTQAPSLPGANAGYMPGFGNDFETEALPDALPQGRNRFPVRPEALEGRTGSFQSSNAEGLGVTF